MVEDSISYRSVFSLGRGVRGKIIKTTEITEITEMAKNPSVISVVILAGC